MGATPSKAQELAKLCQLLRQRDIHFFTIRPSNSRTPTGHPDIVLASSQAQPIAVWLRRYNRAAPLSAYQHAQIEKAASRGWQTLIAFGASEALQELYRRGVTQKRDDRGHYAAIAI